MERQAGDSARATEITPEMIEAGADVIAQNMTDWEVCRITSEEYCAMIFRAMASVDTVRGLA
jgi:hypothetical protein